MARMTLKEKVEQIRTAWQAKGEMIDDLAFNSAKASGACASAMLARLPPASSLSADRRLTGSPSA